MQTERPARSRRRRRRPIRSGRSTYESVPGRRGTSVARPVIRRCLTELDSPEVGSRASDRRQSTHAMPKSDTSYDREHEPE
jgi:hypothetical protein